MKKGVIALIVIGAIGPVAFVGFIVYKVIEKKKYVTEEIAKLTTDFEMPDLSISLSTDSVEAIDHYYSGWKKIMDDGDFTGSAEEFRKMAAIDSQFLVGQALVGRISEDVEEQKQIKEMIDLRKESLPDDERKLLDVFNELLELSILRKTDPQESQKKLEEALNLAEENLGYIAHKYWADYYYRCEYIEVLNYNHGPRAALDSLYKITSVIEQQRPFLLGYAAMLEADLENFEEAKEKATALEENIISEVPKPHVVWGDILLKMGRNDEAKERINLALSLDPGNIDAQRLKAKLKP